MSQIGSQSAETSPRKQLFSLIWPGALAAQAVHCAAMLRIADHVADGKDCVETLAASTQAHPVALQRLLRALCSLGILNEQSGNRYQLTEMGEVLQTGHSSGVHPWAIMLGAAFIWRPWGRLLESVQTGEPAFDRIFGRPFSDLKSLSPEDAEIYNTAMNAGAAMSIPTIVQAYDFSDFDVIVDLGGGRGSLLRGILEAYERPRGVLFDLPEVIATADQLRQSKVAERCQLVGGDFFETVPGGADAYLLRGILHSHDDYQAVEILRHVHRAMRRDGRLLVVDVVLATANDQDPQTAFMDLMMLTLVPGRERTEAEFRDLFQRAGFQLSRVIKTGQRNALVEGLPV